MTIKDKLKSYNFWITLVSAIILLLQIFGDKFNFKVDSNFIIDVTTTLCSIFVVLGIISVPKSKQVKTEVQTQAPNYNQICEIISSDIKNKLDTMISEIKVNQVANKIANAQDNLQNDITINNEQINDEIEIEAISKGNVEAENDKIENNKTNEDKIEEPNETVETISQTETIVTNDDNCLESSVLISDKENPNE